jgi:NAD(P)-dependent dehydrogenase (short-subunit alcohol dehydrogenase family)
MSKKIIITGTSSGFGKLFTLTLLQKGHIVVSSMRGIEGKNKAVAKELRTAGAHIAEIDVVSDASVSRGVEAAIELAGGVDVVVNNAGVGAIGLQENFTPEQWQELFDINVFGVQRVNRAVLPHMRQKRSGLLIHVSSLMGRMALPFYGPYSASKWALEALAENYRIELSAFGIDSCLVEPGGYPTPFMDNLVRQGDSTRVESYGDFAQAPMGMHRNYSMALKANPAQNPQDVADSVANLIDTPAGQRPFRTVVDKMGVGEHIQAYNDQLEQITSGIYQAFGMEEMLRLKV